MTLGVLISWLLVRFFDIFFGKLGVDGLVSGNYFVLKKIEGRREYFVSQRRWLAQCVLWCIIAAAVGVFLIQTKAVVIIVQFKTFGYDALARLILTM